MWVVSQSLKTELRTKKKVVGLFIDIGVVMVMLRNRHCYEEGNDGIPSCTSAG